MKRSAEYENLIKNKALEAVTPTAGAIAQYLQNAANYLGAAEAIDPKLALQAFTLAYEGYFQVVQAVLEFHEVRTKDAGRNLAIQRVNADLKLESPEFALVVKAHARRNATSYTSPFPPVSRQEAATLISILKKYLPDAYRLTGTSLPQHFL
jgi:hypothetical protein